MKFSPQTLNHDTFMQTNWMNSHQGVDILVFSLGWKLDNTHIINDGKLLMHIGNFFVFHKNMSG